MMQADLSLQCLYIVNHKHAEIEFHYAGREGGYELIQLLPCGHQLLVIKWFITFSTWRMPASCATPLPEIPALWHREVLFVL